MQANVQLLDVRDVAQALKVSKYSVRRWSSGKTPKLRPLRLGRRVLFHPEEVSRFVQRAIDCATSTDAVEHLTPTR
jgi:predicted DNA-binding transcriptional regulator AlpA